MYIMYVNADKCIQCLFIVIFDFEGLGMLGFFVSCIKNGQI